MRHLGIICAMFFTITLSWSLCAQSPQPIYSYHNRMHPIVSNNMMVSTQNAVASKVGMSILEQGGNAIDASVAIAFALAVTLPRAGNIGGGGFMVIKSHKENEPICIDYREKAPLKATANMFLDEGNNVDHHKSHSSFLAIGVPGTVAGLETAWKKYGTLSWKDLVKPAIELSKKGIVVDYDLYQSLSQVQKKMSQYESSKVIFYKKQGKLYQIRETLKQIDLSQTLSRIAKHGAKEFYEGSTAKMLVSAIQNAGGIISLEDLKKYRPILRKPVSSTYRGYTIYSMPPPSSGGVHLIQLLNILEHFDLSKLHHNSAQYIHLLAESMKIAYRDRFLYMGDSDFVDIPIKKLISKEYAKKLASQVNLNKITPSLQVLPISSSVTNKESNDTTHFSVIDKWGNAVSNTYSLNFSYGMKAIAKGTGILLNNQMNDFTTKVNTSNTYGLIGGKNNTILPEKRMLSSMSPAIVTYQDKPFLITGSPGGSRIITTTLQIILNVIEHNMNIAEATTTVRVHHQLYPDILRVEKGIAYDTQKLLEKMGYTVQVQHAMGSTQSIHQTSEWLNGYSDPRKPGALTIGN